MRLAWLMFCMLPAIGDAASTDISPGENLFALHVKSLLAEKCHACHGDEPGKLKGGLDLRSRESLLRGGETSNDVLVPGNAEVSLLYLAATWKDSTYAMPPKETDRLTEVQLGHLRAWINARAPWPSDDRVEMIRDQSAEGIPVETSGGLVRTAPE